MKIRVVGPDAVFAILCILLAAAVLWDLRTVPPPVFDPIGSAAVPRALAWLMIAFSLWVLISGLIRKEKQAERKGGRAQWAAMICVAAITLVYAVFITFAWRQAKAESRLESQGKAKGKEKTYDVLKLEVVLIKDEDGSLLLQSYSDNLA